jgi:hypothetical protein
VGFAVDEVSLWQIFIQVLQFSPAIHHSINAPYSSITTDEVQNRLNQPSEYHKFGAQLGPQL